jgi:hypothetical protein
LLLSLGSAALLSRFSIEMIKQMWVFTALSIRFTSAMREWTSARLYKLERRIT